MIAEKLDRSLNNLETLAKRDNGDLQALLPDLLESLRNEVERVRAFEAVAILTDTQMNEAKHAHTY